MRNHRWVIFETSEPKLIENCEKKLNITKHLNVILETSGNHYHCQNFNAARPSLENVSFCKFVSLQTQTLVKYKLFQIN